MANGGDLLRFTVTYRNRTLDLEMPPSSSLADLGRRLHQMTDALPHTIRLLVPRHKVSAVALLPFSLDHSVLTLADAGILQDKAIRMMGALAEELEELSSQSNLKMEERTLGFAEEERRAKQRLASRRGTSKKIPQGSYTFGAFQPLTLPGIELNPPPERALDIMHHLASDPGIVSIMEKHRWKVGIMTEMAPVGYVGISPKCILGYNKNCGEEISLRLRTDDLKGFRKYESIKKTLLHELAHMVHSEHDANFFALNKQLNEEAIALDWSKSKGQTLSGLKHHEEEEEPMNTGGVRLTGYKVGGRLGPFEVDAHSAAAAAAFHRLESNFNPEVDLITAGKRLISGINEPDPDDVELSKMHRESYLKDDDELMMILESDPYNKAQKSAEFTEPDPDGQMEKDEPDPDPEDLSVAFEGQILQDTQGCQTVVTHSDNQDYLQHKSMAISESNHDEMNPDNGRGEGEVRSTEPDPNDCKHMPEDRLTELMEPEPDVILPENETNPMHPEEENQLVMMPSNLSVLQEMQDSTANIMARLQNAIAKLKHEADPIEQAETIQTLFKILRNVREHPNEAKYRRLRKGNPAFQIRVGRFSAALEILRTVGFTDGKQGADDDDYLVLSRDDPGLLWLAQSSLETCRG